MPCERGALSQAQIVVQGVTTVTGEEHIRDVMEGNRYPDISHLASPVLQQTDLPHLAGLMAIGLAWFSGLAWLGLVLGPGLA